MTAYSAVQPLVQRAGITAGERWQVTFPATRTRGAHFQWVDRVTLLAGLQPPDAPAPRAPRPASAPTVFKRRKRKPRADRYIVDYSIAKKVVPWHDEAVRYWRSVLGYDEDADKTIALRLSQFRPSTVSSYGTGWRRFVAFCLSRGEQPLPQCKETVMK